MPRRETAALQTDDNGHSRHAGAFWRRALAGLLIMPAMGCMSSPAHNGVGGIQTEAAAGLAVSPNPALGTQTCTYDTPKGYVIITLPDSEKCSLKPPG